MTREVRALLVVILIFAVGAVGYRVLFGADPSERFRVVTVAGDVQHQHAGGATGPALAGAALETGDRILSGDGGQAVLGLGGGSRVTVDALSSVTVLGITDDGVRVELEEGRVTATVRKGGGSVGVVSNGREFGAGDGDFTVARDADGTVAATVERGAIGISGVDGVGELSAGEDLIVPVDGSPLRAPASETLLLQVAWPSAGREREVAIAGQTQPGATVTVTGGAGPVLVKARRDGQFSARVTLSEGNNALRVSATSILGRTAEVAAAELLLDTTVPRVGVTLEF
ncbi:MAG: hypothetical protein EXR71_02485 [Myxococcales bacterium]|nr:hypothetical protein [Myxococcales bacterium]